MVEFAGPDANIAVGIVPEVRLLAFRLPLKEVAFNAPVDGTKDNLEEVTFCD